MVSETFEPDHDREGAHWDAAGERLVVDVDGFEGPLDVLLGLAREQKVDLARISILQLADQYSAFIERAHDLRLSIAADYLVMAAWLAYLKSRMLLPDLEGDDEPTGDDLAAALAFQLRRLEAMREAGTKLMARPLLGRDTFARGEPEGIRAIEHRVFDLTYYELLRAYAEHKRRTQTGHLTVEPLALHTMNQALKRLRELLGGIRDWSTLASFLPPRLDDILANRSVIAATFVASLELARQGRLKLRQSDAFAPIFVRASGEDG